MNQISYGISLEAAHSNTISENNIKNATYGLYAHSSDHNIISGNNITGSGKGIALMYWNHYNIITRNYIAHNSEGIYDDYNEYNTVYENNITNNTYGYAGWRSAYDRVFHNNFINNTIQFNIGYTNFGIWDNGYPSGGNYWSNYNGLDEDQDGLGDTPIVMDSQNKDNHPLMGPFNKFYAGTWNETSYNVDIISRSKIASFNFSPNDHTLTFDVEGENGTTGFCRITIPRVLMWCDDPNDWAIKVGGYLVDRTIIEDGNLTYIYFTYEHSIKTVQIQSTGGVPEFAPLSLLLLIITITLATLVLKSKRKNSKVQTHPF
jgi:parallel beta-helix repeat protein